MKNFIISYQKNNVYQAIIVKAETEENARKCFAEHRKVDIIGMREQENINEEIRKGMPIIFTQNGKIITEV